jgi:hypothetical protein
MKLLPILSSPFMSREGWITPTFRCPEGLQQLALNAVRCAGAEQSLDLPKAKSLV